MIPPLEEVVEKEVAPNVFHLLFPNSHQLIYSFMRFQEYYESPSMKGKIFTQEEFEDDYAKRNTLETRGKLVKLLHGLKDRLNDSEEAFSIWNAGNVLEQQPFALSLFQTYRSRDNPRKDFEDNYRWFIDTVGSCTYNLDCSAFNLPSTVFEPFKKGKFDPLTKKEKSMLDWAKRKKGRFYVIGTDSTDELQHEIAHGLFFVNKDYHDAALKIVKGIDFEKTGINKCFKELKYHPDVWEDEAHAYVVEDLQHLKMWDIKIDQLRKAHKALNANYNKHMTKK